MDLLLARQIGRWPLIAALVAASLATNSPIPFAAPAWAGEDEVVAPPNVTPELPDCAAELRKPQDNRNEESAPPKACKTERDNWTLALRLAILKSISSHPFGFFR